MRKRKLLSLLAIVLVLVYLAGCGIEAEPTPDPLASYNGTWYMAKNGVACQFGDGKIYRDDQDSQEGQTLCGIYRDVDGRVEANLAGVGGVHIPRSLYVVQTDVGEVLCDSPDGNGTIYFYRDAVVVLALLEEAEAAAEAAALAQQAEDALDGALAPGTAAEEPDGSAPGAGPDQTDESPGVEDKTGGSGVWIPQSGTKYHSTATCSGMKNPSQITKAEAERRGYTPCKRCH